MVGALPRNTTPSHPEVWACRAFREEGEGAGWEGCFATKRKEGSGEDGWVGGIEGEKTGWGGVGWWVGDAGS